ncbi:MAG: hypothetical protein WA057_00255 [Candidatus Magasanikiibacteriota bacterium]
MSGSRTGEPGGSHDVTAEELKRAEILEVARRKGGELETFRTVLNEDDSLDKVIATLYGLSDRKQDGKKFGKTTPAKDTLGRWLQCFRVHLPKFNTWKSEHLDMAEDTSELLAQFEFLLTDFDTACEQVEEYKVQFRRYGDASLDHSALTTVAPPDEPRDTSKEAIDRIKDHLIESITHLQTALSAFANKIDKKKGK